MLLQDNLEEPEDWCLREYHVISLKYGVIDPRCVQEAILVWLVWKIFDLVTILMKIVSIWLTCCCSNSR